MSERQDLDYRLPAIRSRDIVIAALRAAFGNPDLMGPGVPNPYLFNAKDPQGSKVWISSGAGRMGATSRDARRNQISVNRGEYTPQENHLHNMASMAFGSGSREFTDTASTTIMITCEAGTEVESEALASICYQVLKLFRQQIMQDFDIFNLRLVSVGSPMLMEGTPGKPYATTVMAQVTVQEHARMIEVGNTLNRLDIRSGLNDVVTLDATPT
ncbi:MAG TPA: hypothetical protein VLH09_13430 [Bryobacteraceae bacterium]|nr:hypothetical protein [Bryobacteraceae bacterium]